MSSNSTPNASRARAHDQPRTIVWDIAFAAYMAAHIDDVERDRTSTREWSRRYLRERAAEVASTVQEQWAKAACL
jgi:hypothetical protein